MTKNEEKKINHYKAIQDSQEEREKWKNNEIQFIKHGQTHRNRQKIQDDYLRLGWLIVEFIEDVEFTDIDVQRQYFINGIQSLPERNKEYYVQNPGKVLEDEEMLASVRNKRLGGEVFYCKKSEMHEIEREFLKRDEVGKLNYKPRTAQQLIKDNMLEHRRKGITEHTWGIFQREGKTAATLQDVIDYFNFSN